jgi:hypothetical protein
LPGDLINADGGHSVEIAMGQASSYRHRHRPVNRIPGDVKNVGNFFPAMPKEAAGCFIFSLRQGMTSTGQHYLWS